eukprot:5321540-Amphidinium_carterae.1
MEPWGFGVWGSGSVRGGKFETMSFLMCAREQDVARGKDATANVSDSRCQYHSASLDHCFGEGSDDGHLVRPPPLPAPLADPSQDFLLIIL